MKHLYVLSIFASLFALTACSSNPYQEEVELNSMLPGAEVYINGELVGETPCTVELSINSVHEVKFVKEGFNPESYTLSPAPVDSMVKFGFLVDTGYYRTLTPSNVYAEMKPSYLPATPGKNAFESYTENYLKVDALRKFGKISKEEYDYIINYMNKFYTEG